MSNTNLTRASRDGDQFHYLWGARRCLNLLSPNTDLVAISIEGPSPDELNDDKKIEEGEDILDIAEYFGSEKIEEARLVRYLQLKHSTFRVSDPWTASGLEKTLKGFAKRYNKIQDTFKASGGIQHLEFWFVTNRPISTTISEAIEDAAKNASPRHPLELKKLQTFTNLKDEDLASFFKLFHFEDGQEGYWEQRNILSQELIGYLPGSDTDAPVQLKELVTNKALSESEDKPTITKIDVLRVLRTNEGRMFPAKCLIKVEPQAVPREQEFDIIESIVNNNGPFLIHAEGGVGKSIFATRISELLPENSVTVLYDCFGNGQYRSASGYRHRHKDALVQIANELASKSLCHPLIPSSHADSGDYVRAFNYRLKQAIELLRATNPKAILAIVIDAADNSQMAAMEVGEKKSFAPDLIRETVPEGVRLIFLCRPYRQDLLDPPSNTISIELKPFSLTETAKFLSQKFPESTVHDVNEFHRLSSQNPRVQALALSQNLSLPETLRLLGPNPTTVEATIAELLNKAIQKLKSDSAAHEKDQINRICVGLAALRPLIPIAVLSAISGIEEAAIKSFAYDIGRPLLVTGDMIQFLDEPAESWFRKEFKPTPSSMAEFINILKPLAHTSVYISSILPHLMLEAGQFDDLVKLALSTATLPEANELERRDIELQRLQFALKASLRSKHYADATKLALKAGGESAGEDRQAKLLQNNIDLASAFLTVEYIQETVSRQIFDSSWTGSHHVYEASILSGKKELVGDARSRLRMAHEWLRNLMRIKTEDRDEEKVSYEDILELTFTHLNIHGPENAANYIRSWTPREISYHVGRKLIKILIEHGRWSEIDEIAVAAENNLYLIMAVAVELCEIKKLLPIDVCRRAIRLHSRNLIKFNDHYYFSNEDFSLKTSLALIETSLRYGILPKPEAAKIVRRYIPATPPRSLGSKYDSSRYNLLKAYCLLASLEDKELNLIDLAHEELRKEIEKDNKHSTSRDLDEFNEIVGSLLPWHKLWARSLLDQKSVSSDDFMQALKASKSQKSHYSETSQLNNEIALSWMSLLHSNQTISENAIEEFIKWKSSLRSPLYTKTLNALCRICGSNEFTKDLALSFASESYELIKDERVEAETKSEDIIEIARSVLISSQSEARAYFNEAMKVVGKLGTENFARWRGVTDVASIAAQGGVVQPELAYQFARCAELTRDYIGDRYFEWDGTLEALTQLSPISSLTIISRWRDRKFGSSNQILPRVLEALIDSGQIDPLDVLPFMAFRAEWDLPKMIKFALDCASNSAEKVRILNLVSSYLKFIELSTDALEAILKTIQNHQLELHFLSQRIEMLKLQHEENKREHRVPSSQSNNEKDEEKPLQWHDVFSEVSLETTDGFEKAYKKFKKNQSGFIPEDFFKEAFKRAPVGKETAFIHSILHFPSFHYYHLDTVLKNMPSHWQGRLAVTQAFSGAIKSLIRKNFTAVAKTRLYGAFPNELIQGVSGVTENQLFNIALSAYGETSDPIETDNHFNIVGMLSTLIQPSEALDVLKFALDLYNFALEDKDGDGPWSQELLPPSNIKRAIAGYLWSALSSPEATVRWEASHAVLGLCKLNRQDIIDELISMPESKEGLPYADVHLEFYYLHAFQWLLIGLCKAALETPESLSKYGSTFINWAITNQAHVLIRQFAAQAALNLHLREVISIDEDTLNKLKHINKSTLPAIDSKKYSRTNEHDLTKAKGIDDDIYYFGIYWLQPLGRVFGLSENEISAKTLKVIRDHFATKSKNNWKEDERAKRNLYPDRETWHSHGDSPRTDNLQFYHCYHAMMMVAGELLSKLPTHYDSEYQEADEFFEWLTRHQLSRADGRWLWDRRDIEPLIKGEWLSRDKNHPNYKTLLDDDFLKTFILCEKLILWGDWTEADSYRSQTYHITSALVIPDKAEALFRALSTTEDPYDYYIPSASSDSDLKNYGFELTGWIKSLDGTKRLDEYDPWSGGISFSAAYPTEFVVSSLSLKPDIDFRYWRDESNNIVMFSEIWGHFDESHRHSQSNLNHGDRLVVSSDFLKSMLKKLNRYLIVEVQIERNKRHRSYERDDKNDEESIKRTSRIFLIDSSGKIKY